MSDEKVVEVRPPYIKLEQFLKLCSVVETGGTAKIIIGNGSVKVDGEVCLMRGKKLKGGEKVEVEGKTYICALKEN